MTTWKLEGEAKERLQKLIESAENERELSKEKRRKLDKILGQKTINLDDAQIIKDSLPPHQPLYTFFNRLNIHFENCEYRATPEFRAKTDRLRERFKHEEYKKLVENVDPLQAFGHVNHLQGIGTEMKKVNRQLTSIFNVLITVVGAFFFGFSGVNYAYPHLHLDLATRFIIGLVLGTVVFFADLYFVIKGMDEGEMQRPSPYVEEYESRKKRELQKDKEEKEKKVPVKSAKAKKND